jgi:hypothetical protein
VPAVWLGLFSLLAWPVNAAASDPATVEASAPPLYRYTDDDNTVWLMGSVHAMARADFDWISPDVDFAFANVDRVLLESEAKPGWWHSASARELYPIGGGSTWRDFLSGQEIDQVEGALRATSFDASVAVNYVPSLAVFVAVQSLLIGQHELWSTSGVETRVSFNTIPRLLEASPDHSARPHLELDYLDHDIRFFRQVRDVPLDQQAEVIVDIMRDINWYTARYADAVQAWRTGDLDRLERALDDYAGIYRAFGVYDAAIPERAHAWSDQIAGIIESDVDTMIIIGAEYVHLDNTVLDRLGERGYVFSRVQ